MIVFNDNSICPSVWFLHTRYRSAIPSKSTQHFAKFQQDGHFLVKPKEPRHFHFLAKMKTSIVPPTHGLVSSNVCMFSRNWHKKGFQTEPSFCSVTLLHNLTRYSAKSLKSCFTFHLLPICWWSLICEPEFHKKKATKQSGVSIYFLRTQMSQIHHPLKLNPCAFLCSFCCVSVLCSDFYFFCAFPSHGINWHKLLFEFIFSQGQCLWAF